VRRLGTAEEGGHTNDEEQLRPRAAEGDIEEQPRRARLRVTTGNGRGGQPRATTRNSRGGRQRATTMNSRGGRPRAMTKTGRGGPGCGQRRGMTRPPGVVTIMSTLDTDGLGSGHKGGLLGGRTRTILVRRGSRLGGEDESDLIGGGGNEGKGEVQVIII
jgi:hypothetical protein